MSAEPADLEIESLDVSEDNRGLYAWLRAPDGTCWHWSFDLALPPGQSQTLHQIEGA